MKLKSCGTISLNLDEMSFSACTATSPRVHLEYSISSRRQMLLCFSDSLHLKHISMVLAGHEELEHTIFCFTKTSTISTLEVQDILPCACPVCIGYRR